MAERADSTKLHSMLGHPLRKSLIEYLDKTGGAGFKELKESLGVTVGTLYYHLEILGDLVIQNPQRKYMLSEKGRSAKKLLEKGAELQSAGGLSPWQTTRSRRFLVGLLFAPRLFNAISEKPLRFLPVTLGLLALSAFIFEQARMEPTLLLYITQPVLRSLTYVLAEVLLGWLGLFLFCEAGTYLLYKRTGGEGALLLGIPLSLIPSLILPLAVTLRGNLGLTAGTFAVFFLLFQAWSFLLLIALIALVKGLPVEKGAGIMLIIAFANLAIYALVLPLR